MLPEAVAGPTPLSAVSVSIAFSMSGKHLTASEVLLATRSWGLLSTRVCSLGLNFPLCENAVMEGKCGGLMSSRLYKSLVRKYVYHIYNFFIKCVCVCVCVCVCSYINTPVHHLQLPPHYLSQLITSQCSRISPSQ